VSARSGNGSGVIATNTYGAAFTIFPHSYSDLNISDSSGLPRSSGVGSSLANTRFIC